MWTGFGAVEVETPYMDVSTERNKLRWGFEEGVGGRVFIIWLFWGVRIG